MQRATLLLLLSLCAANGQESVALTSGDGDDSGDLDPGCKDWLGRSGAWDPPPFHTDCGKGGIVCLASRPARCVIPDLPPRLVGGIWECDEHYELAGTRSSWPGGVLLVQPEKCRPV